MNPVAEKNKSIINVIAHCIEHDEQGVKNVLKRNGVDTSVIKTKRALRTAFISALGKSKAVALDFNRYIEGKKKSSASASADGDGGMFSSNLNLDDFKLDTTLDNPFQNNGGSPLDAGSYSGGQYNGGNNSGGLGITTSTGNTSTNPFNSDSGGGFFSGLNLKDLLNTGVGILEIQRDIKVSKDNKEAIENAVQIKQDEINLKPSGSNGSVGLYVALGLIGLTMVGGLIYVATKKK